MNTNSPRALLVDDTAVCRSLARRRLEAIGIQCDEASTCEAAEQMLRSEEYSILVTELHLPGKHPYHLVTKLLRQTQRPLIVVATDIREPRLAKHLFEEGVEDVLFKPINYELLAAKLQGMAIKWQRQWSPRHSHSGQPANNSTCPRKEQPIRDDDLQTKLRHLTGMLPLSTTTFDVFNATRDDRIDATQLEQTVAKESSLAVEVLRLANSAAYSRAIGKITSLSEAIVRIGRRKIGELALALTAKATLTQRLVPWLDVNLLWHRSVAASAAAELLQRELKREAQEEIVLGALVHGLGRVVLASLYPAEYDAMLGDCEETGKSLDEIEEERFPLSPSQVIGRVLQLWDLPEAVWQPLANLGAREEDSENSLLRLTIAIGDLATGDWQDFDRVTDPADCTSLPYRAWGSVLTQLTTQTGLGRGTGDPPHANRSSRIPVISIESNNSALPKLLLESFTNVESASLDDIETSKHIVIDCRSSAPYSLAPFVSERVFDPRRIIFADRSAASEFKRFGTVLSFPQSYRTLRDTCLEGVVEQPSGAVVSSSIPFQIPMAAGFDAAS